MNEKDWVCRVAALLAPYMMTAAFDHAMDCYADHGDEDPDRFAQDEIDAIESSEG